MRPTETVAATALGPLETRVMETLWERGKSSVRDVVSLLDGGLERSPAYTTVMTTLDRLFKKGMLERRVAGRGYSYWPRWTRQEWERKRAGDLVKGFLAGPQPASGRLLIPCLVEAVGQRDMTLLDELEEKIRMKRDEAERGKP
jgi:predicted transcriptional regulator